MSTDEIKEDIKIDLGKIPPQKCITNHNQTNIETENIYSSNEFSHLNDVKFQVKIQDTHAFVGPVGLMGFGLTTFLLNLENAGVYPMSPVILGMGLVYGGLAQFITGILEWKKGNNFTTIAFLSYGSFWWSFVLLTFLPKWGLVEKADEVSLSCYLFIWLIFTCVMLGASFTKPWAIRILFMSVAALFILLIIGHWGKSHNTIRAAGVVGIICAFLAIYAGAAEILNDAWKKTILPLGAPGEKWLAKTVE